MVLLDIGIWYLSFICNLPFVFWDFRLVLVRPCNDPTHLYFVTATIAGWKKLFSEEPLAQIVLESLKWLIEISIWSFLDLF